MLALQQNRQGAAMTRAECIEAIARAIDPDAFSDDHAQAVASAFFIGSARATAHRKATAAYDAMQDHMRAERERVREMCLGVVRGFIGSTEHGVIADVYGKDSADHCAGVASGLSSGLRALDIGGQDG